MKNFKQSTKTSYNAYTKKPGEGKCLSISINYQLGGMSYFSGQSSPRGYYLSLTTVERSENNGFFITSCSLFEGLKSNILPATRFSRKTLTQLAEKYDALVPLMAKIYDEKFDFNSIRNEDVYKEIIDAVKTNIQNRDAIASYEGWKGEEDELIENMKKNIAESNK